jgi:YVTN family beta-propeller protein
MNTLDVHPSIIAPNRKLCWVVVGLLALVLAASPGRFRSLPSAPPDAPGFGSLPLWFVPNAGQTAPMVRFQARSANGTLFFSPDQITFSLAPGVQPPAAVRLRFEGANPALEMAGVDPLAGSVNYFIGNDPARWRTDLPAYAGIVYRDVYPGIDLHYAGTLALTNRSLRLKGTYAVAPGADPARIRWRYQGAAGVRLDAATGDLRITLPGATGAAPPPEIVEHAPVAWQTIVGRPVPVSARYTLAADGSVGFALGDYNPAYALTLDPALTFSTYLGGNGNDNGYGVAVDADGNVYVTGSTTSTDFPTLNAVQPTPHFSSTTTVFGDAFVLKLAPDGNSLVYATYLGGIGGDVGWAIAVDSQGNATVAGDTTSIDFPAVNAPQPVSGGGGPWEGDAFVARLAPGGNALAYATYLGGGGDELAYAVAVDGAGNATVAGYTSSVNFPTAHAPQPNPGFPQGFNVAGDAFVTRIISASGVYTWGYSTYLGGTNQNLGSQDVAYGVALDAAGDATVTGQTGSADFPLAHPVQATYGGATDAFVTKIISASGVYTWGYSTYLGGSGGDVGYGIAVDDTGAAYVTGQTGSADFPTTSALQSARAGTMDAFVTKIVGASGVYTWGYSTYLGGSGADWARGVVVDGAHDATLTGNTLSTNFPLTADAYDRSCGSDGTCNITYTPTYTTSYADAFLARLNAAGTALSYATYLGGSQDDWGRAIALGHDGSAYVAGITYSADFPTTAGAFDTSCGANGTCDEQYNIPAPDAFVAKIAFGPGPFPSAGSVYLPVVIKALPAPPSPGCAPALIASIPVGDTPRGVAVAPGRVYVANYGSNSVSVVDSAGNAVLQTLNGISGANGVAYDPTHNHIWVTNYTTDQVTPIDGASLTPLAPVAVGDGPWGVAYDPIHDFVYVVNHLDNSVTVVNALTRTVVATLTGTSAFSQPFHIAANPATGKVYVTNFGTASVGVVNGLVVGPAVDLANGNPSTQPYGIAVDETRNLVYVATVDSHRVVAIDGATDQVLNWAEFHRGSNPARPVPLRVLAVNPGIGPSGDGGHIWATTSTADGSEADQALLIPKGWSGGFAVPVPATVGANPAEGIAVDRASGHVYVTGGGAAGTVTVLADGTQMCPIAFGAGGGIGVEVGGK